MKRVRMRPRASDPAKRWKGFAPPPRPEAERLRRASEAAMALTPEQVLEASVKAGIHNPDGTLTRKYGG